jgi:pimeloyl-ACP methyl ester carboxylesterase
VERNFQKFLRRHADAPGLDEIRKAYQKIYRSDPGDDDDDAQTANFRDVVPIYFADYWRREPEFSALREAARRTRILDDRRPYDHRGRLSSITAPTLVVTGRYDVVCPPRWSEEIHGEIKGSTLAIFESSGHFAHLEEPHEFARTVRDFVDHQLSHT